MRAEPKVGRPTQSEHVTAQPIMLRTGDGDALYTFLQTVRNEDDSFDTYVTMVTINGKQKMFAWHTINFSMACEVPRLDKLMNWLHERPGRTFPNLDLIQLGFMDADHSEDDPAYAKKWQSRGIVYASGKKSGWESNCFHASDQDHGDCSTFWQVRFNTISSFRVGGVYTPGFLKLGGRKISTKAGKKFRKNEVPLEAEPECREGYLDVLFFVCVANEDVLVPLGAAESKGSSKIIQQLLVHNALTFCTGDVSYFMRTAVANAIVIAAGHGAAREMLELEDIPNQSLAAVGAWIESALKKYYLRKLQVPDWQETHEYLLAQKSGFFWLNWKV